MNNKARILILAAAAVACDNRAAEPLPAPTAAPAARPVALELYRVPLGDSPAKGGGAPRVTVVVFSEFQCPFCGRITATLEALLASYGDDLRVVFKHRPLPFHD